MRLIACTNEGLVVSELAHIEKLDLKTAKDKRRVMIFIHRVVRDGKELDQIRKKD